MAFIFEKLASSGFNALMLDPREKLLIPFDFGDDWKEIRLGLFCSFSEAYNPNKPPKSESISSEYPYTSSYSELLTKIVPSNIMYVGFKDRSLNFPYTSGSLYAGWTSTVADLYSYDSTTAISRTSFPSYVGNNYNGRTIVSGETVVNLTPFGDRFYVFNQSSELNNGFAGFNCIVMKRTNGKFGRVFLQSLTTAFTDVSIQNLRKQIDTITTYNLTSEFATGYLSDELNAIFIYSPLLLNSFVIHAMVVEKYT